MRTSNFLCALVRAGLQSRLHHGPVRLGDASGTDGERPRYGWGTPPVESVVMRETCGGRLESRRVVSKAGQDARPVATKEHECEMAQAEFEAAEAIIAGECRALLEVGEALLSIRRGAGHRYLGFTRFEDYMYTRWHLGSRATDWSFEAVCVASELQRK